MGLGGVGDFHFSNNLSIYMLSIIAPCYNSYPILIPSLILQSHKDWELIIIHDGPNTTGLDRIVDGFNDPRVKLAHTPARYNDFGHSLRAIGLEQVKGDFVLHTNHDNYYVPRAFEFLLEPFVDARVVAVFCDMVHNHYGYTLTQSKLEYSHIDCGAIVWRASVAKQVGWPSRVHDADWLMIDQALRSCADGEVVKIQRPLFIHN